MSTPRQRVRERSTRSLTSLYWRGTSNDQPPVVTDNSYPGLYRGETEVMVDTVTPGFTSKLKLGTIINNAMHHTYENYEWAASSLVTVQTLPVPNPNATTNTYQGEIGAHWDRYVLTDPNFRRLGDVATLNPLKVRQLAAIEARKRISPIAVQSLVSLIEFPKTFALITQTVNSLRRLRRHVVNLNFDKALQVFGTRRHPQVSRQAWLKQSVENRWLEFRYGWTPLVFEVQGAIKALSPDRVFNTRGTARGFAKDSTKVTSFSFRDDTWYGRYDFQHVSRETLEARAYCLYTADLQYQSARDFGIAELPLAAWELVPFSFVADWFVGIGDWIEALTPKLGVTILAEGVTFKRECINERKCISWTKQTVSGNSYDASGSFIGSTDRLTIRNRERTPHLNILYNLPPLNVRLNTKRVLDAIALFGKSR